MASKRMTIEDLRNMVAGNDGEDRISALPDELIHHILYFVDVRVSVQMSVLSKRWMNVWTTLPYLNFGPCCDVKYFVSQFLSKRNPDCDTIRVTTNCKLNLSISNQILDYADSHNVKHIYLVSYGRYLDPKYNYYPRFSFPVLQTLHLECIQQPLEFWGMPSLTSLHLNGHIMDYSDKALIFDNLKELTLNEGFQTCDMDDVVIKCPNLECLSISWEVDDHNLYVMGKFVISAPKLSSFKFYGNYVPVLSADFCCLEDVDFDFNLSCGRKNINEDPMENLNCLFRQFRGIKFLTLSWGTMQVLMEYSKWWPSPFSNLKTLHIRAADKNNSYIISYLLNNSSDAKIFIECCGQITNYNPEEDILSYDNFGNYHVEKTKKQMASSVHVDAAVLHRITELVRPPPTFFREFFKQGYAYQKHVSFSLWEGHHVCRKHLALLHCIMKKHPETFEHFAPQTGTVSTVGLNTLCNSVKALTEVCTLPASTITHFRALFTDLERWGFNTTWLVNILNNIIETSTTSLINK